MNILTVFVSDRGDQYLPDCIESYAEAGGCARYVVIDDSEHHLGMAGAVEEGFRQARDSDADYVFWCEEDFLFDGQIPLYYMTSILDNFPHLAQLVLKRQPWSDAEKAAGGQIETNPEAYKQRGYAQMSWVEHRTLFSLNPCLIPRRTLDLEWAPDSSVGVERVITDACLNAGLRFAYYGRIEDEPRCEHVGYQRSAGYRW